MPFRMKRRAVRGKKERFPESKRTGGKGAHSQKKGRRKKKRG